MNWFGPTWGAPVTRTTPRVETPIGQWCDHCGVVFTEHDRGVTMPSLEKDGHAGVARFHLACVLAMIGLDVIP